MWRAQREHPFVRAIADGSVDRGRFRFWVRQDYLFLIEYARLFGIATARAPDLATMNAFATLTRETLETEMNLHRAYAAEFGISEAQLEAETKAPATQAYTDFLLRTAALGDYAELVAALLPCMWGFSELGTALKARGLPDDPLAARWIESYAAPEFVQLAAWCRDLMDGLAAGLDDAARKRCEDAFVTSSRYELRFWEMAERLETW
ncbi:MAG TPA: thiaminase II [Dehalococcoidia bacterium]|nr:thiaminase II [Dehalococcoidia bacterium]